MKVGSGDDPKLELLPAVQKRRRMPWALRILLAAGLMVLLASGIWALVNWMAGSEIQKELARYRALGQPACAEDLNPPAVPAEDNAATYLLEAANSITFANEMQKDLADGTKDLTRDNLPEALRLIQANANVLSLARQARDKKGADWGERITSENLFNAWFTQHSTPLRALCKFLRLAGKTHHLAGDDDAAVETIRDQLRIAPAVENTPFLISFLVGFATEAVSTATVEDIATDLRVCQRGGKETAAGSAGSQPSARPASREQVRALIAWLLDEEPLRVATQGVFYGERVFMAEMGSIYSYPSGGIEQMAVQVVTSPFLRQEAVRGMRLMTALAEAIGSPNWHAARGKLPQEGTHSLAAAITRNVYGVASFNLSVQFYYWRLATRRMAALALAIRLYEIDHGHRPEKLTELVPEYLPEVPKDPFAADNRPMSYLPAGKYPVLYSVGLNGIDEGGMYGPNPDVRGGGGWDPNKYDLAFFLGPNRPAWPKCEAPQEHTEAPPNENAEEEEEESSQPPQTAPASDTAE